MGWDRSAQWTGPSMLPQRIHPAARLLPGLLIVAAAAWWGLSIVGTGQPVRAQAPANAKAAAGRVEGGSDVLPLGTSATGTIAELLVHAGAHVQAGQHLVRIECSAIERELDARKSDLAAAEAFYLRTLHGPRVEETASGSQTSISPMQGFKRPRRRCSERSSCARASP
jgi:multidrug efflux pump subunit AcrA (membrane-fusion protein)